MQTVISVITVSCYGTTPLQGIVCRKREDNRFGQWGAVPKWMGKGEEGIQVFVPASVYLQGMTFSFTASSPQSLLTVRIIRFSSCAYS